MENWQSKHKQIMFRVLQALYMSKYGKLLGFKGGTALYFFYGLPRFSVDLDFDITENLSEDEIQTFKDNLLILLQSNLPETTIKTEGTLKQSFRYVIQYGGLKTLKLEINSKIYENKYEIRKIFGIDILLMEKEYMFAHKLCAFLSRYRQRDVFANRDLYDIGFFFDRQILPAEDIILKRSYSLTGKSMTITEYLLYLHAFIGEHRSVLQKNILDGLGELIDEKQKAHIKNHLLAELLLQLDVGASL